MTETALLLAGLCAWQAASVETSADLEATWRREYPAAAAELEKNARSFLARGRLRDQRLAGNTLTASAFTVASSRDKGLIIRDRETLESPEQKLPRPNPSLVFCRTPQYAFLLRKESPGDRYAIAIHSEKFDQEYIFFGAYFDEYARCATLYQGKTLLERMQSPSFAVRAVNRAPDGGRELLRIDYTVENVFDGMGTLAESGSVYLDPGRDWVIRRAEGTARLKSVDPSVKAAPDTDPRDFRSEVEYQEVSDRVFFPKRLEISEESRSKDPNLRQHRLMELDQITFGGVPDEVFKLSGYGLPDVPLRPVHESAAFSLRNPLFWGALVVAVISFALLWLTRGRKSASAPPTVS